MTDCFSKKLSGIWSTNWHLFTASQKELKTVLTPGWVGDYLIDLKHKTSSRKFGGRTMFNIVELSLVYNISLSWLTKSLNISEYNDGKSFCPSILTQISELGYLSYL